MGQGGSQTTRILYVGGKRGLMNCDNKQTNTQWVNVWLLDCFWMRVLQYQSTSAEKAKVPKHLGRAVVRFCSGFDPSSALPQFPRAVSQSRGPANTACLAGFVRHNKLTQRFQNHMTVTQESTCLKIYISSCLVLPRIIHLQNMKSVK